MPAGSPALLPRSTVWTVTATELPGGRVVFRAGRDRGFRSARAAWDRFLAWEAARVLPVKQAEVAVWRARPDVAPWAAVGLAQAGNARGPACTVG
jgi:hypothetical protein